MEAEKSEIHFLLFLLLTVGLVARSCDASHSKSLSRLLEVEEFVLVLWTSNTCRSCDIANDVIEEVEDSLVDMGIAIQVVNDRKLSKKHNVDRVPSLSLFRGRGIHPMALSDVDPLDSQSILSFFRDQGSQVLQVPGVIKLVAADDLANLIEENPFVAVLFCDRGTDKDTRKVLEEIADIEDEAKLFDIHFVRIRNPHLAEELSLSSLPALVYYRTKIPVVFYGDLDDEDDIFEFLYQNKFTAFDEVEEQGQESSGVDLVSDAQLSALQKYVKYVLVLACDKAKDKNDNGKVGEEDCEEALVNMEDIGDALRERGVSLVVVKGSFLLKDHVDGAYPELIFFRSGVSRAYPKSTSTLHGQEILGWVLQLLHKDGVEAIDDEMLTKLIGDTKRLVVLFYSDRKGLSEKMLSQMRYLAERLDDKGIDFARSASQDIAEDFGITQLPKLASFKNGVPQLYEGDLDDRKRVLSWLYRQCGLEGGDDHHGQSAASAPVVKYIIRKVVQGSKATNLEVREIPRLVWLSQDGIQAYEGVVDAEGEFEEIIHWLKNKVTHD